jgi:hypothetical protein
MVTTVGRRHKRGRAIRKAAGGGFLRARPGLRQAQLSDDLVRRVKHRRRGVTVMAEIIFRCPHAQRPRIRAQRDERHPGRGQAVGSLLGELSEMVLGDLQAPPRCGSDVLMGAAADHAAASARVEADSAVG